VEGSDTPDALKIAKKLPEEEQALEEEEPTNEGPTESPEDFEANLLNPQLPPQEVEEEEESTTLAQKIKTAGRAVGNVVESVPRVLGAGATKTVDSVAELVVNVPKELVVDPVLGTVNAIFDTEYEVGNIDSQLTEMLHPNLTYGEDLAAEGVSFLAFFMTPVKVIPGAKALQGSKLATGASNAISYIPSSKRLTSLFDTTTGLVGGRQAYFKGLFAAGMTSADRETVFEALPEDMGRDSFRKVDGSGEDVGEIHGRLINVAEEALLAPLAGGIIKGVFKGLKFLNKVARENILHSVAVQIDAEILLKKLLTEAGDNKAMQAAALKKVIARVDKGEAETLRRYTKTWQDDIKAVETARLAENSGVPTSKLSPPTAAEIAAGDEALLKATTLASGKPMESRWLDLATIFKSTAATKRLAKNLGIKITREGSRKHLSKGDLQEAIADKMKMSMPAGSGKREYNSLNTSTVSNNRANQEATRRINENQTLKAKVNSPPRTFDEMSVELDAYLKKHGYVKNPGADDVIQQRVNEKLVSQLADGVDNDLQEVLLRARALDAVTAINIDDQRLLFEAMDAGGDPVEAAKKLMQNVLNEAELVPATLRAQKEIATGLGYMRHTKDGSKVAPLLHPSVINDDEAFSAFMERLYPGVPLKEASKEYAEELRVMYQMARQSDTASAHLSKNPVGYGPLAMKVLVQGYVNSMLSRVTTAVKNIASPVHMTISHVFEDTISSVSQGEFRNAMVNLQHSYVKIDEMKIAFKRMVEAWKANDAILSPKTGQSLDYTDVKNSVIKQAMGRDPKNTMEEAIDYYYNVSGVATRGLVAGDEFSKNIVYQSKLRSLLAQQASKKAREEGLDRAGEAAIFTDMQNVANKTILQYTREGLAKAAEADALGKGFARDSPEFTETYLRYMNQNWDAGVAAASKEAMERADEVTFMKPLDGPNRNVIPRTIKATLIDSPMANHYLYGAAIKTEIPFITVPANMLAWWTERIPAVAAFNGRKAFFKDAQKATEFIKSIVSDISYVPKTPAEKKMIGDAYAKLATGSAVTLAAYNLAVEGKITGAGPPGAANQAAKKATGWRPYSMVDIDEQGNKTYISFMAADPWAGFLGSMADTKEAAQWANGTEHEFNIDDILVHGWASTYKNITDRSFMEGAAALFTWASGEEGPEREAAKQTLIKNVVPLTGLASSFTVAAGDPFKRVNNGQQGFFHEAAATLKSILPGLSKEAALMQDPFGRPIMVDSAWGSANIYNLYGESNGLNVSINPFKASVDKEDPIANYIDEAMGPWYGQGFSSPVVGAPKVINIGGFPVDLTEFVYTTPEGYEHTFYDKFAARVGTIKANGLTLSEQIISNMEKPAWDELPPYDPSLGQEVASGMSYILEMQSMYQKMALVEIAEEAMTSDDPETRKIGVYIAFKVGTIAAHVEGDIERKKMFVEAMEDLTGNKNDAAVLVAENLTEAGTFLKRLEENK
jgi:hypothetical protein